MNRLCDYDVVILGGGLAGLTLSLQLKRACPDARVLVAERRRHPVREAAFKVGESTVEGGGHYYANVLGLRDYLERRQLIKPGLRFYFPSGDNTDVTRRVELGQKTYPKNVTYQLDRGRFENDLGTFAREHGVVFIDGTVVEDVELAHDGCPYEGAPAQNRWHEVSLNRGGERARVTTRWVADASGHAGLVKRKLGLAHDVPHKINAAWFRLGTKIDIGAWSDAEAWTTRVTDPELRWFSTNHLMGPGYWVWLIPLSSGSTSVGIVADEDLHALDTYNSFEKALRWLRLYEPQCYEHVAAHVHTLQDFLAVKHYAHSCHQMFSPVRWGLVGVAGVFHDPFYSPGSDMIGTANTLLTDLIARDLGGEEIRERTKAYNDMFLRQARIVFDVYQDQYKVMGNPQVFTAKVVWDAYWYISVLALLYLHNRLTDLDFIRSIDTHIDRCLALQERMQQLFRDWHRMENTQWADIYCDSDEMRIFSTLHDNLTEELSDDELRAKVTENMLVVEEVARQIFYRATQALPVPLSPDGPLINPYAVSLDPARWQADGLFRLVHAERTDKDIRGELRHVWLDVRHAQEAELAAL